MTSISILGTGNMGSAIQAVAERGGHPVQLLGTEDQGTTVTGDIVVLAVPHTAIDEIIATRADQLAGKVVVDLTNPVDFDTFDDLVVPADSSMAAKIATALPSSQVVKAFNTNFASTLAEGTVGPLTTTALVAGDDEAAKQTVTEVLTSGGLKVIDAGALKRARELEALGFLQITLAAREKFAWTEGFGIVS
ncbi:NADPH-dependent F420 reductase [Janibacter terrae]|uniref:NADPH-dependent F420 reductase n=1 Tax=Janibacter terrae TaxID=103817 RepID=A0ABZ2FG16_9MICO|nr:NADPH-dependent F420 reductase [Janibacter terrae]MBA4085805.1 diguanylate cyclase [Kytococcus sp.]